MREVGVQELKERLSGTLHAVGRGEAVRVTLRGRPLVDIVPGTRAGDERLHQLIVEGRVVPPARSRPVRAPRLLTGTVSASEVVLAERDNER